MAWRRVGPGRWVEEGTVAALGRPAKRRRTVARRARLTWLGWLRAQNYDAFIYLMAMVVPLVADPRWGPQLDHTLLWRVPWRAVAREVVPPRRFHALVARETLKPEEISRWFVRWLSRRHAHVAPAPHSIAYCPAVWDSDVRVCGAMRHWHKVDLVWCARKNNVDVRKSWSKPRIIAAMLKAAPPASARFCTYLVHRVEGGRVVAEQRAV
jgi:hypothetical protein